MKKSRLMSIVHRQWSTFSPFLFSLGKRGMRKQRGKYPGLMKRLNSAELHKGFSGEPGQHRCSAAQNTPESTFWHHESSWGEMKRGSVALCPHSVPISLLPSHRLPRRAAPDPFPKTCA